MQSVLTTQCIVLMVMLLSALSLRFGWLGFKPSFLVFLLGALILTIGALVAVSSLILSVFSATRSVNMSTTLPQLLLGLLPIFAFLMMVGSGGLKVPKIHDISTRHEPPIVFEKAVMLRKADENSLAPPTEQVKAQQRDFYTSLKALEIEGSQQVCFELVQAAVKRLNWVVIAESSERRWLEAYESTALLGFKDDIRVEITDQSGQCRIDARSVSRVGMSDLGVNAKRIQRLYTVIIELAENE